MTDQVEWTRSAERDLRRLDEHTRARIYAGVRHFAATGQGDITKLRGRESEWRLRIGDVRVRFPYPTPTVLRVLRVLPQPRRPVTR